MKIFLDSSVLIEILRSRIELSDGDDYFINPVVYAEVGYGFISIGKDLEDWDKFLESKKIMLSDIDLNTAKIYVRLKYQLKHRPIADNDLLVACSCLGGGMTLWTLNKKHFNRVNELRLKE